MATTLIAANADDGVVQSSNTVYATARAGSGLGLANTPDDQLTCGQQFAVGLYFLYSTFLRFDTSGIIGPVSSATLSLYLNTDGSTADFTSHAYLSSWSGGGLTVGDWVAGGSVSALTRVATFASSGVGAGYNAFTSDAAFVTGINTSGFTEIMVVSANFVDGVAPSGDEYLVWYNANDATRYPTLSISTEDNPLRVVTSSQRW